MIGWCCSRGQMGSLFITTHTRTHEWMSHTQWSKFLREQRVFPTNCINCEKGYALFLHVSSCSVSHHPRCAHFTSSSLTHATNLAISLFYLAHNNHSYQTQRETGRRRERWREIFQIKYMRLCNRFGLKELCSKTNINVFGSYTRWQNGNSSRIFFNQSLSDCLAISMTEYLTVWWLIDNLCVNLG